MTSVLAKTTREILSEYAAYMGTNRCRLVPISAWEALLSDDTVVVDTDATPADAVAVHVDAAAHGGVANVGAAATGARTLKPQLIEPLCGRPISVVDVKGRARQLAALREHDFSAASAISFLVADVRRFGCELSPACRLGSWLTIDEDPGFPDFVVVGIAKDADVRVVTLVEAVAADADKIQAAFGSDEVREARRTFRHHANDAAAVIAAYLRAHPKVAEVRYPGLKDKEQFKIASTQLVGGFGPIVDFRTKELPDVWQRLKVTDDDPKQQILNLGI